MDKIGLLKTRRAELLSQGSEIRKTIAELIDGNSFVELDSYSFSRNEFYGADEVGEGVVTGYATINDNPFYIVAQNNKVLGGGLSLASCRKIVKCLDKALDAGVPVIYLLSSHGVQAGEGVGVLEGVSEVLMKMQQLKGSVPQFSVTIGDVYGQASLFIASCDYNYFLKDSCVCATSPLVVAAKSGISLDKSAVGGAKSAKFNALCTFEVESIAQIKDSVLNVLDILPAYNGLRVETGDDFNRAAPSLNEKVCPKCLIEAVFDKDYFIELGKNYAPEVVTGIGRVGGFSVAAIVFGGQENGVEISNEMIEKIIDFIYYADDNGLPVTVFVNSIGLKQSLETNNSLILKRITTLFSAYSYLEMPKINVVTGKAIGLGYTLFASKATGANYTYAFANAQVSLFDSEIGARVELGAEGADLEKLKEKYTEETQDAINAAKDGLIDDIIEPQFVRSYLISALQMLL